MSIIKIWIIIYAGVLIWSGVYPRDQFTWFLEVVPAMVGAGVLAVTYRWFRLTPLVYWLILFHCTILMVGGHYTYAEVPLFDYLKDLLGSSRNDYDKLGHFAQGFVPALVAREIIIRKDIIKGASWQRFFIVAFCLGLSACYELIEWWVALATGSGADAFLGTQGDIWDTQSDMFMALIGSIVALATLSKLHDRQLQSLPPQRTRH